MLRFSVLLRVLLSALLVVGLVAQAQVPAENQALLLMRILAFDRKAPVRAGSTVRIALVSRPGQEASEAACREMESAVEKAARTVSVGGLPVRAVRLPYTGAFEAELGRLQATALYVCPGLGDAVGTISRAARAVGVLSFTGDEALVDGGLSVGLVRRQAKAAIVVNLKASRAEGADLDSGLLRLAEVR